MQTNNIIAIKIFLYYIILGSITNAYHTRKDNEIRSAQLSKYVKNGISMEYQRNTFSLFKICMFRHTTNMDHLIQQRKSFSKWIPILVSRLWTIIAEFHMSPIYMRTIIYCRAQRAVLLVYYLSMTISIPHGDHSKRGGMGPQHHLLLAILQQFSFLPATLLKSGTSSFKVDLNYMYFVSDRYFVS